MSDIPLDEAELLSVLLEALLYGFSLLMFGATIWTLVCRRPIIPVNYKMCTVACLLLLGSTAHFIIGIIRVMEGLVLYRHTFPGGPVAYFADVPHWTLASKGYVFVIQTLIGDSVVLYRCYVVWQSKLVLILPVLLWCSTFLTGIASTYIASRTTQSDVFGGALSQWITAFWVTALATNLLTTLLLVYRIWRKTTESPSDRTYPRALLHTLLEAGAIYTFTLLTALLCFVRQTNGQYVVLNMVTPIISITFYMVIILAGWAGRAKSWTSRPLRDPVGEDDANVEQRRRVRIHITRSIECKVEDVECQRCQTSPITGESTRSETQYDQTSSFDEV